MMRRYRWPANPRFIRHVHGKWLRHMTAGLLVLGLLRVDTARADDNPPQPAPPQPAPPAALDIAAAELTEQGLALYKAHDYRRATEKFLQAYAIEPDPNLWFNVARCYQALGDSAAAIEKYEAYLRSPSIDPSGRERAEKSLKSLREADRKQVTTPRPAAPPAAETSPAGGREKGLSGAERDAARAPAERVEPRASGDATRAVVGWIVTAALGAGTVVTGMLAVDSARKLETAREVFPGDRTQIDGLVSKTTVFSMTADGLGAATAVGAVLSLYWTVTRPSPRGEVRAAVGASGIQLSGSF